MRNFLVDLDALFPSVRLPKIIDYDFVKKILFATWSSTYPLSKAMHPAEVLNCIANYSVKKLGDKDANVQRETV